MSDSRGSYTMRIRGNNNDTRGEDDKFDYNTTIKIKACDSGDDEDDDEL